MFQQEKKKLNTLGYPHVVKARDKTDFNLILLIKP
jgi:hypothetical protein